MKQRRGLCCLAILFSNILKNLGDSICLPSLNVINDFKANINADRFTGHVTRSLEAALWAFHNSDSFKKGCLLAINLGDDADTTGAIYGQLAGAYYGEDGIPEEWRLKLAMRDLIERFAETLYELKRTISI